VASALRHVSHMFELAGHRDPRRPLGGKDLLLAFSWQARSYRNADPLSESQIALPVKLFTNILDNEGASSIPLKQATSDIITIMFYFLLRIGEITGPQSNRARRTIQFRRCNTSFWATAADGSIYRLPPTASLAELMAADQVTLKLTNQKNGVQDSTLHHDKVPGSFCPFKAVAHWYHTSRQADPTNPMAMLCLVAPQTNVLSKHVDQILQQAALRAMIWNEGFELNRIGPRSI
jgi:hypothetical protein